MYILNTCLEGQICNLLKASGFYDLLLKLNRVILKYAAVLRLIYYRHASF